MRPMTLTVYLAHTTPLSNSKGFAYNAACSNFLFYDTPPTCAHALASKLPHSPASCFSWNEQGTMGHKTFPENLLFRE